MFCRDKQTGRLRLSHSWLKKVQRYPYIDILKVQAIREKAVCRRCGSERITIVNLSAASINKKIFREDLWEDM